MEGFGLVLVRLCFLLLVVVLIGISIGPIGVLIWAVVKWDDPDCDQPLHMWLIGLLAFSGVVCLYKCHHQLFAKSREGFQEEPKEVCLPCVLCAQLGWVIAGTVWYAGTDSCENDFKTFSFGVVLWCWLGGCAIACIVGVLSVLGGLALGAMGDDGMGGKSNGPTTVTPKLKKGMTREIIKHTISPQPLASKNYGGEAKNQEAANKLLEEQRMQIEELTNVIGNRDIDTRNLFEQTVTQTNQNAISAALEHQKQIAEATTQRHEALFQRQAELLQHTETSNEELKKQVSDLQQQMRNQNLRSVQMALVQSDKRLQLAAVFQEWRALAGKSGSKVTGNSVSQKAPPNERERLMSTGSYMSTVSSVSHGSTQRFCKPVPPNERERLHQMFTKYDKDDNGTLDIRELHNMCLDLGGNISESEAMAAMKELDKNRSGTCDFDEFLLFWSSQSGLGGYHSMALNVLKTKMWANDGLRSIANAHSNDYPMMPKSPRRNNKGEGDNCAVKWSFDLSPASGPEQTKMSASVTCAKITTSASDQKPNAVLRLALQKEEEATKFFKNLKRLITEFERLSSEFQEWNKHDKLLVTQEEGGIVVLALNMDALPREIAQLMHSISDSMRQMEVTLGFGGDINDCISRPDRTVLQSLKRVSVALDMLVSGNGKQSVAGKIPDQRWPTMKKAVSLILSGVKADFKVGYDEAAVTNVLSTFGLNEEMLTPANWRRKLEKKIEAEPLPQEYSKILKSAKELMRMVHHIDSLMLESLVPDSEVVISFKNFNPFPLVADVMQALDGPSNSCTPKSPAQTKVVKTVPPEEKERLQSMFTKYDRDGDGSLDAQEILLMCSELGAKVSESEAQEALTQLDQDGNGTCDFEEFLIFWSSNPRLGGYHSFVLAAIKMKMAAQNAASILTPGGLSRLHSARKLQASADDCVLKGSFELLPKSPANATMSASVMLCKGSATEKEDRAKVTLRMASEVDQDAAKCVQNMKKLFSQMEKVVPEFAQLSRDCSLSVHQDKLQVVLCFSTKVLDEEKSRTLGLAADALKSVEISVSAGGSINNMVTSPDVSFIETLRNIRITADAFIPPEGKAFFAESMPDAQRAIWWLFQVVQVDLQLGYNEGLVKECLKTFGLQESKVTPQGWRETVESHIAGASLTEDWMGIIETCKETLPAIHHVDTLTLENLAGGAEIVISFKNFNPFVLLAYFLQSAGSAGSSNSPVRAGPYKGASSSDSPVVATGDESIDSIGIEFDDNPHEVYLP